MTRRASLPGAEELFRTTTGQNEEKSGPDQAQYPSPQNNIATNLQVAKPIDKPRHDEKVTFYCTGEDLTRLERARLELRATHRLVADRGRIVRAALSEILDDFEARGANSSLVKQLEKVEKE